MQAGCLGNSGARDGAERRNRAVPCQDRLKVASRLKWMLKTFAGVRRSDTERKGFHRRRGATDRERAVVMKLKRFMAEATIAGVHGLHHPWAGDRRGQRRTVDPVAQDIFGGNFGGGDWVPDIGLGNLGGGNWVPDIGLGNLDNWVPDVNVYVPPPPDGHLRLHTLAAAVCADRVVALASVNPLPIVDEGCCPGFRGVTQEFKTSFTHSMPHQTMSKADTLFAAFEEAAVAPERVGAFRFYFDDQLRQLTVTTLKRSNARASSDSPPRVEGQSPAAAGRSFEAGRAGRPQRTHPPAQRGWPVGCRSRHPSG